MSETTIAADIEPYFSFEPEVVPAHVRQILTEVSFGIEGALGKLTRLALEGDPYAADFLGGLWLNGRIVDHRSAKTAAFYFKRAALGGWPSAASSLADLYLAGEGVPQDLDTAEHWATLAAEQGDPHGMLLRGRIALACWTFFPETTEEELAEGIAWLRRAAELRSVAAWAHLAEAHLVGIGSHVRQDLTLALGYYSAAIGLDPQGARWKLSLTTDEAMEGAASSLTEPERQAAENFAQGLLDGVAERRQ